MVFLEEIKSHERVPFASQIIHLPDDDDEEKEKEKKKKEKEG